MTTRGVALKLLQCAVFLAVMFVAIQVAIVIGVERKSWLQLSWEFLVGGSGVVFFVIFGAIGWVCGALYGGLGLLSLMVGGALGGLGLGAVANIARSPRCRVLCGPVPVFNGATCRSSLNCRAKGSQPYGDRCLSE
jgi:hypothetical protein